MNKSFIYIIIATYNAMNWIGNCLSSCKDYPVLVVDNASTDETINYIKKNHQKVVLLEQEYNRGFGAANNIGISYAINNGADYVFLLNQDVYLEPNTIEHLLDVHIKHPKFGILSPLHFNGQGDGFDRKFSYFMSYDRNENFYFDAVTNKLRDVYSVPFVNAAAWLLPKSTIEKIGGFDPVFFHYGEDDNYCQRVLYHKLKIGVVPTVSIKHDRPQEHKTLEIFSNAYFLDKEANYKRILADINIDNKAFFSIYKTHRNNIFKHILSGVLKVKIKAIFGFVKELKLLKKSFKESKMSREINAKFKRNYINLD